MRIDVDESTVFPILRELNFSSLEQHGLEGGLYEKIRLEPYKILGWYNN